MRNNKFKVAYVVLPTLAPLDDNSWLIFIFFCKSWYCLFR